MCVRVFENRYDFIFTPTAIAMIMQCIGTGVCQ